jgi:uncharacterized repeat protein (TIGR03803 family)
MKKSQVLALCLALLFSLFSAGSARAQATEKTVLSFNFNNGTFPGGGAFDRSGNLWVVTGQGGNGTACETTGCGVVVEFTPVSGAWVSHVVYNFHGGSDGEYPSGRLYFDSKGNAYGTTQEGGSSKCNCGTVYELSPSQGGWKETVLYRFNNNRNHIDGLTPYSGLIADAAGNLYGTSITGGTYNWGTVYELSPNSHGYWTERVLWSFQSPTLGTDGSLIYGALAIDASGNLYGATYAGGSNQFCSGTTGCGAVFELSPGADGVWTERIIYNFQGGSDGARSYAELIFDNAGNLYGTTLYGGSTGCSGLGCGTVFELSPVADGTWTESVLHAFSESGRDGLYPRSGVVFDQAGNLDGVTSYGGMSNWGSVFSLTPVSGVWTETQLYSFALPSGVIPSTTPVIDASGNIYGTTLTGGTNRTGLCDQGLQGCGVVFEIKP